MATKVKTAYAGCTDWKLRKDIKLGVECIKHWRQMRNGGAGQPGVGDCPYCKAYFGMKCVGCPIRQMRGRARCEGTPYHEAYDKYWRRKEGAFFLEDWVREASREIDYLVKVQSEMVRELEGRQKKVKVAVVKMVDGWLCRDEAGAEDRTVVFYWPGAPVLCKNMGPGKRSWVVMEAEVKEWTVARFKKVYGTKCLPEPGEKFMVEIQL